MAKVIDPKMVKAVEAHGMKMTAACDDGGAFFVFVRANGKEVLGGPVLLTPAKIKKLAALKPLGR